MKNQVRFWNLYFVSFVKLILLLGYESSSRDSISVQLVGNSLYVFARSFTNSSLLFVSTLDYISMLSTPWRIVGGESTPLMTDASVAYNSFTQVSYHANTTPKWNTMPKCEICSDFLWKALAFVIPFNCCLKFQIVFLFVVHIVLRNL